MIALDVRIQLVWGEQVLVLYCIVLVGWPRDPANWRSGQAHGT